MINLKKKLGFAKRGVTFLEYKREQLMFQIRKYWKQYLSYRKKYFNLFRIALITLNLSYRENGKRIFNLISILSKIQYGVSVNINYYKELGNLVPKIDYKFLREEKLPPYSFENTSFHLDDLYPILKDLFTNVIQLAEREDILLKLALNFKNINRRINSLNNIIIPSQEIEIKKIKEILEESERENFIRLKKTKELINK